MSQPRDFKLLKVSALAFAAGLAATGAAFGQEAQPQPTPDEAETAPAASESEDAIVVTGSRIRRNEFTSDSPIQVLQSERAELAGTADTAQFLQGSTLAAGSAQNDATISSAFVTDGGPGSATLSLRGLGSSRTLVLLNGRRIGPAGTRGAVSAVDLNVIPQGVVERIEILKDGASSIYGSDAIAGVANIITRRNTDGLEVELFAGLPVEGGGEDFSAEAVYGRSFDRGYFQVSANYYLQQELAFADREFLRCGQNYTFSAATGLRNDLIDPRTNNFRCAQDTLQGQVWLYEYSNSGPWATGQPLNSPGAQVLLQFDPTGQLGTLVPSTIIPAPGNITQPGVPANWFAVRPGDPVTAAVINYGGPNYLTSSLFPETERASVFFEAGYDLTPNIELYGEVLLNRRETYINDFRQFWTYLYTETFGDPLNVGWTGFAILSPTPTTDHADSSVSVDYMRAIGGARGDFAAPNGLGAWNWDIFYQFSRSDGDYTNDRILNDAVRSAQLRTGSCVGTNLPVSGRPCVDINWLGGPFNNGFQTAQERAFLFDRETGNTLYEQQYVEGSLSGDIFALPAGNVAGAIGFHYRTDEIDDVPGRITLANNAWGSSGAGRTVGEDTIGEVFGEIAIPILAGLPFVERLDVTASGRYTEVDTAGEASTYKLGLSYQVTPAWQLRYTTGTSYRAPGLFENFLAEETSFIGQRAIDPCINYGAALAAGRIPQRVALNCAADGIPDNYTGAGASATSTRRGALRPGSPGPLEAETSDAWTVGLVYTPQFINLNLALDYTEIEISDTITAFGPANIVGGCYFSLNFATEGLCNFFDRGATASPFLITNIRNPFINVASQTNRALDLTARYDHEFAFGDLNIQSQITWQLEDTVALFPGRQLDVNGDVGEPDFVGNLDFRFNRGDWTYFWGMNFIGKSSEAEDVGDRNNAGTTLYKVNAEFSATHDASIRYQSDEWAITGGVSNIFDERPPTLTGGGVLGQYSTVGTALLASQYDSYYVGRRAFVRLTRSW